MQQDVLLFRSHRQVQHQRTEQASQRHQQGRVPRGAYQPSERKWKEPWVPGAPLVRVDVRAGTSGPRQTHGARGRTEHGSCGRVEKAMHAGRTASRHNTLRFAPSRTNIVPSGLVIARYFRVLCLTFVDDIA